MVAYTLAMAMGMNLSGPIKLDKSIRNVSHLLLKHSHLVINLIITFYQFSFFCILQKYIGNTCMVMLLVWCAWYYKPVDKFDLILQ